MPEIEQPVQAPVTATDGKETIKNAVKALLQKAKRRDELKAELAKLNAELREYGLDDTPSTEKATKPKKDKVYYEFQDSDVPKLIEFIGKGSKGYGEIATQFGAWHISAKTFAKKHKDSFVIKEKKVSVKK